jgi:hypothetical protein
MKHLLLIFTFVVSAQVHAKKHSNSSMGKITKVKGHFQFRTESADNQKGVQSVRQTDQSVFRARTDLTFSSNKNLDFNLSPQATKGFGADDSNGNTTSGSTTHSELYFYQANIDYKIMPGLSAKIGRQEIAYGEHLIIGSLPWANNARSFDAIKFHYKYWRGWTDLFYSKISDNASTLSATDDVNLVTLYNSMSFNKNLKALDIYYIHQNDDRTTQLEINSVGLRAKGSFGALFYRTENTFQSGSSLGDDAYQYDIELGGKLMGISLSAEYALAGKDYRQLYPTTHKFLGIADVLGRRNIQQYAFHLKGDITSWLTAKVDYHIFTRDVKTESAYKLDGTSAWGTTGNSDEIGDEIDAVLILKTGDNLNLQLGGGWFSPGKYMKDNDFNNKDKTVKFTYAQLNAKF